MKGYARSIDVTTSPELQHLAEQVRETRTPVELTRDEEVLAVVRPAPASRRRRVSAKRPPSPVGSVVERTAGMLKGAQPALSPEAERAAAEQAWADEAVERMGA
jgi:hypothetical protein